MPKTAIKICPGDNGQTMRLKDFEHAEVQEGYLYELSRGVITVSNVPKPKHMEQASGEWVKKSVRSPAVYKTPLFPGLAFATEQVFKAGK